MSAMREIACVGKMEPKASGLPCSLASSPEVDSKHGVRDILELHTSPKELGNIEVKQLSSAQADRIHHLLSPVVLDPLVESLVDRITMDMAINNIRSQGTSGQGTQGSELVVEGNLELSFDLAEKIVKDLLLQCLGIPLPSSGPAAKISVGHGREMAVSTEAIKKESANTRDSAAEDSTTSTARNSISNIFRRTISKWRKKSSKVGPALSKKT
ncbi:uncharacterized protein LOC134062240 [Sardina pilchardus]|uniref:uncharacterized protein LOC134062240 n=1 Tax=Sardina pilchardus TaxID=27697 RepID=UPI002E0DD8EF